MPRVEITGCKFQEHGPIRSGSVTGRVLPERDVAAHECGFDFRKLLGPEILLAQQPIDRSCTDPGQERTLGIDPAATIVIIPRQYVVPRCGEESSRRSATEARSGRPLKHPEETNCEAREQDHEKKWAGDKFS